MAVDRETRALPLDGAFAHLRSGGLAAYERMLSSEDAEEGPRSFSEGRDPHWQGR
jgi:crotonobetainyl-CoA hydratase